MNYVVGASMLVSQRFLAEVGLMAEEYFLFFEETDWAWRGRPRFRLDWAPGSRVYHKVGQSIGTSSDPRRKSLTCDFYALRNRLLFTRRHCPAALPAIRLSLATAAALRLLCGRREHAALAWDILRGREAGWERRIRAGQAA
jgi:GT2 family glycosyltransferase